MWGSGSDDDSEVVEVDVMQVDKMFTVGLLTIVTAMLVSADETEELDRDDVDEYVDVAGMIMEGAIRWVEDERDAPVRKGRSRK